MTSPGLACALRTRAASRRPTSPVAAALLACAVSAAPGAGQADDLSLVLDGEGWSRSPTRATSS